MSSTSLSALSGIQNQLIAQFSGGFTQLIHIALVLFVSLAVIDIAIFGLVWAFSKRDGMGALVFKVFKIGVVFAIISLSPYLLQHLINGFIYVAAGANHSSATSYMQNPLSILSKVMTPCLATLKLAVDYGSYNIAMALIYIIIAFSILIIFTLIVAQIMLMVLGFYLTASLAMLMIPFGALSIGRDMFAKAIQAVFSMGARVFSILCVVSLLAMTWDSVFTQAVSDTTPMPILLVALVYSIVFGFLMLKIPALAAEAIGKFGGDIFADFNQSSTDIQASPVTESSPPVTVSNHLANLQTATTVAAAGTADGSSGQHMASPLQAATDVTVNNTNDVAATTASSTDKDSKDKASIKNAMTQELSLEQREKIQQKFKAHDHETR